MSKSLRLPREKHFEPQKVIGDPGALTVLISKSLSRYSVVQTFATGTSKSAPIMPVFNDFDYQIHHSVVQILATSWQPILRTRPSLGADFPSQRSHTTVEKHSISRFPTRQNLLISHVAAAHLCAITSLGWHISWLTDLQRQFAAQSEIRFLNFL